MVEKRSLPPAKGSMSGEVSSNCQRRKARAPGTSGAGFSALHQNMTWSHVRDMASSVVRNDRTRIPDGTRSVTKVSHGRISCTDAGNARQQRALAGKRAHKAYILRISLRGQLLYLTVCMRLTISSLRLTSLGTTESKSCLSARSVSLGHISIVSMIRELFVNSP